MLEFFVLCVVFFAGFYQSALGEFLFQSSCQCSVSCVLGVFTECCFFKTGDVFNCCAGETGNIGILDYRAHASAGCSVCHPLIAGLIDHTYISIP